jgi:hypothetical protein
VDYGDGDGTAAFSSQDRYRGLIGCIEQRGLRLFGLNEPDGDPNYNGRPHPILFHHADYFKERRRGVADCCYGAVQTRSATPERGKRARHAGLFGKLPAFFTFGRTNYLVAVPFETPWRKPCPDHPCIRIYASPAPERFYRAADGIGREANPPGIIEVAGGMDNAAHYLPLVGRKAVFAHLFVDDAKTLPLDLPSGLDQAAASGCALWWKLHYHCVFTSTVYSLRPDSLIRQPIHQKKSP